MAYMGGGALPSVWDTIRSELQKIKITFLGEVKTSPKSGKPFREVGADEFNGERKAAFDRTCEAFAPFKVGDEVEVELSANGKYINTVQKVGGSGVPTQGSGGKGFSKGGFSRGGGFQPDPEKNAAVYTKYALDFMAANKSSVKEAVDTVFAIREAVKGRL